MEATGPRHRGAIVLYQIIYYTIFIKVVERIAPRKHPFLRGFALIQK
jgi:hypothetical protein